MLCVWERVMASGLMEWGEWNGKWEKVEERKGSVCVCFHVILCVRGRICSCVCGRWMVACKGEWLV